MYLNIKWVLSLSDVLLLSLRFLFKLIFWQEASSERGDVAEDRKDQTG